jgi:hypothetical protein
MAAALAQVRNALQAIGIVDVKQRDAITDSIMSMDVFEIATADFIKDMCKNICRPGGTLPNPNVKKLGAPNYDSLPWSSNFTHCRGVSCAIGILHSSSQAHFLALSGSVQCGAYFLDDQD